MDVDKSEKKYDIYAMIGRAVTYLIESGGSVKKDNIVKQLRNFEAQSVDGTKKLYRDAAIMVESGWTKNS